MKVIFMRICILRMGTLSSLVGDQCRCSRCPPGPVSALQPLSPESTLGPTQIKDGVASLSDSGGSTIFRAKTELKNLNAPLLTIAI